MLFQMGQLARLRVGKFDTTQPEWGQVSTVGLCTLNQVDP
jgi:hypothetical protein